jgi:uncharacterized protein YyaL (SSP411 family)
MSNRLAGETSPYLLQHAENPVDWWPWGPEALAEARRRDCPILLSIGYAACHWCHVMAHESFEDADTAAVMNALFVNIKVDREERPDLDGIYMQAVQAMTGHGGWPMTMFLTPEGEPFYGGTYYPPTERHGMPSFRRVMESVAEAWNARRDDVTRAVRSIGEIYSSAAGPARGDGGATVETLTTAYRDAARRFEPLEGGFGGAPKFPPAMTLDFVLRYWARTGEPNALMMVRHSYRKMARGGIHDQIGGGFHRYTVDAHWLVPHFEKMLYDNALLSRLGVHLWQATGDPVARDAARDTLDWVLREMTDANGGWYSSLDADSEGEEGRFYVWSVAELRALLGDDHDACARYWGVSPGGNFEGENILSIVGESPMMPEPEAVSRARAVLYAARAKRVWPGRDEKILAAWNGLMLRAMAEGARVFEASQYRDAATANGEFLWSQMVRDGRAWRTHMRGETRIPGFLEDTAGVALGLLALYELTFDARWLERATAMGTACIRDFWSDEAGAFYDTAHDHERLVARPRDVMDNAVPSGTSLAAELMLRLAAYTGDAEFGAKGAQVVNALAAAMDRYAPMFGQLLCAADLAVHGATEVVIVGDVAGSDGVAMRAELARRYVPGLLLAGGEGRGPLFAGRTPAPGVAVAYLCRGNVCAAPAQSAAVLGTQLDALRAPLTSRAP